MRKIRIRLLILSFLILFVIFGSLGYFFSHYTTTVIDTKIQEVNLHKTETYSEQLANLILGDYEIIAEKVDRYLALNPVEDFLNVIIHFEKDPYITSEEYSVYSLTNDTLLTRFLEVKDPYRLKNNAILLTQKFNLIKNVGSLTNAYELYLSYQVGGDYLIFARDFTPLIERVFQEDSGSYYLITTAGDIICEKVPATEIANTLFYYLVNSESDNANIDLLKREIQDRRAGFQNIKFQGSAKTFFYTPLLSDKDTEEYAFVYVQSESVLLSEVKQIRIFTLVFIVLTFVISFVSIIYMMITVNNRTYELVTSKFSYAKAKSYIMTINKRGKIKYLNRALKVKAKGIEQYLNIYEFSRQYDNVLDLIKESQPFVLTFRTPEELDLHISFVAFKKRGGYELVGTDVSSELGELHHLRTLALYNSLTKLPNKDHLLRDIKILAKSDKKECLLMFSIVNFRNTNRIFGRMIGDKVLLNIKDIVTSALLKDEVLYHLDSDNFAVLKSEIQASDDVTETVKRLLKLFENPLNVVSNMLAIKIKIGIYNFEQNEKERSDFPEYAISNAHLALRKARESRQLDFASFDISIGQVLNREMVMENDLKEALTKNELMMYYQPQYDTRKNKIVGFEALMKWNNPKYMNESTEKFIRMAEQNGLIIPMGHFVIEETFRVAKLYEQENIKISLNISPIQILQSGFIRDIEAVAKKVNLNPGQISFEITETFMIESFNEVIDKLKILRDLGYSIHLDDFGTGFSSLLYIKELPINTLKIDKEFLKSIVYDEFSRSIVAHIIDLSKSLNLDVIAEGVETEDQKKLITKSGCNIIQGYLISKAVPEDQINDLLTKYNKK